MSNKKSVWTKSLVNTSPILIIAVVCVFLSIGNIMIHEEVEPSAAAANEQVNTNGDAPVYDYSQQTYVINAEAKDVWATYNAAEIATGQEVIYNVVYQDSHLSLMGVLDSFVFGDNGELTLWLVSDNEGNANVECIMTVSKLYQYYIIEQRVGSEIVLTGDCAGYDNGIVTIENGVTLQFNLEF